MKQRVVYQTVEKGAPGDAAGGSAARFKNVDLLLERKAPLDESEQEKLVQEFQAVQLQQMRTFQSIFGAGSLLLSLFFGWAAWAQATDPYGQRWTGELRPGLEGMAGGGASGGGFGLQAQVVLALQAAALVAAGAALLLNVPKKGELERGCMPALMQQQLLMWAGLLTSGLGACYWLYAHHAMVSKYGRELGARWELLWVPLAPLGYCGLCSWVVASLRSTGQSISALKGMQYRFKKA